YAIRSVVCHLQMVAKGRKRIVNERLELSVGQFIAGFFELGDVLFMILKRHAHDGFVEFGTGLAAKVGQLALMFRMLLCVFVRMVGGTQCAIGAGAVRAALSAGGVAPGGFIESDIL